MKPNIQKTIIALFLGIFAFFGATASTRAQTVWINPGTGDWFVPANWSAGVPNAITDAKIQNGGTAQINLAGANAHILSIGGTNSGALAVNGIGTLTDSLFTIVGDTGIGSMSVTGGGKVSNADSGVVGFHTTAVGTATISGAGSNWTTVSPHPFFVGYDGKGTLNITNGGAVSNGGSFIGFNAGSMGMVNVNGAGSTWNNATFVYVGDAGNGTLNILNGGSVLNAGLNNFNASAIARQSGSTGMVLVDGTGSNWTINNANIYVGGSGPGNPGQAFGPGGNGLLQIQNGGRVTANQTVIWSSGTVFNDATLASDVSVEVNGFLGGSGTVTGNTVNSGNVSPGHVPTTGTLTINGNYTQNGTGILRMEIAGLAQHDLLSVGGSATLSGTLRLVQLNSFNLDFGDRVLLVGTGTGVNGTFTTVQGLEDFGFGTTITYEPANVFLERLRFGAIAPEELTAPIFQAPFAIANVQSLNLEHRMDQIRNCSTVEVYTANGKTSDGKTMLSDGKTVIDNKESPPSPAWQNHWDFFVTGLGQFAQIGDDDFNARGSDIATGGVTIGMDRRVGNHFAFGLYAGYAHSDVDLADDGNVKIDGGQFGLYATYFSGGFYLDGAVGGGLNSYETRRLGVLDFAHGETDGTEFNGHVATGYDWKWGRCTFGPIASFQYTRVDFDGFTETGSLLPLDIREGDAESIRSTLGLRFFHDCKVGRVTVRPEVRASWQHEYGDRSTSISASFQSPLVVGSGTVFTVNGPTIGRDSALVEAGVSFLWNDCTSVYVYYHGDIGRENYESHSVTAGFQVAF